MAIAEIRSSYTGAEKPVDSAPRKQETADKVYKNSKEYLDYLGSKYSCLQGTEDSSVTIAPDLLSKAATDSKTSQWLEENLKLIPDILNKTKQNAAQNGARVVSCNIFFDGYDSMTTQVHTVSEGGSGASDMKKALDEIRTKNKEQKKHQEDLWKKRERSQIKKILTNDAEGLLGKVANLDFAHKNNEGGVSIDYKI